MSCCGFDSIPHDLGVLYTVGQLANHDLPVKVEGFVRVKGTFSGGTWQSAINAFARPGELTKKLPAPRTGHRQVRGARMRIHYEPLIGAWACPLPTIDPEVVLRSAGLLEIYGPSFEYGHYAAVRSPVVMLAGVAGVGALVALAQLPPTRALLRKVRSPGEGPSAEQRAGGWFKVTIVASNAEERMISTVSGGEPGYSETSKMISEAALCLAFDHERRPKRAGVLTPAVAMGEALTERLQSAGIRFSVVEKNRAVLDDDARANLCR